jgi:EAL domain-containing protein (putative c-di-GMP-specific phosphodiesterase class I)/CheY-like chemotaxis protein
MSTDQQRVRVLVADDDSNVRRALAGLIENEGSFDLVGQAGDAEEAVELARRLNPDVALMDVRMPGGGGPRATRSIRESCPRTQVVAFTAHPDRDAVLAMIKAGAVGFLLKGIPGEELISAIRRSARGQTSLSTDVAGTVVDELVARLEGQERDHAHRRQKIERIRTVLLDDVVRMVFQPIADIATGEVVGFEALSRFHAEPERRPDQWFEEAHEVGLGVQLELVAIRAAVKHFDHLPRSTYLSVNVSPVTALSPHFEEAVSGADPRRLVVEITEHARVADYDALAAGLQSLRLRGARLAVDDAGSGFASLRHILRLSPDIIKLDRSLVADIDADTARHALASALILFADKIGSSVVAEGLEEAEGLLTLRALGVKYGQGYYLGRPAPLTVDPRGVPTLLAVPPIQSEEAKANR